MMVLAHNHKQSALGRAVTGYKIEVWESAGWGLRIRIFGL